jgi:hypothetical protein
MTELGSPFEYAYLKKASSTICYKTLLSMRTATWSSEKYAVHGSTSFATLFGRWDGSWEVVPLVIGRLDEDAAVVQQIKLVSNDRLSFGPYVSSNNSGLLFPVPEKLLGRQGGPGRRRGTKSSRRLREGAPHLCWYFVGKLRFTHHSKRAIRRDLHLNVKNPRPIHKRVHSRVSGQPVLRRQTLKP